MILASLKPYYYYLIGERKKTIEVRKTALKNLPQDIAFYMSKDEKSFAKIPKEFQEKYRKHFGKVGMRVVCDKVIITCGWRLRGDTQQCAKRTVAETELPKLACLTIDEIVDYAGSENREVVGWHISDLKVYNKPKQLREFCIPCKTNCEDCKKPLFYDCWKEKGKIKVVTRPPQSWQYVEELEKK